MNRYVPQSVMTPEGEVLDIHIVLNEMFKSGDKLFVEYSDGPIAYKARLASDTAPVLAGLIQAQLLLLKSLHTAPGQLQASALAASCSYAAQLCLAVSDSCCPVM